MRRMDFVQEEEVSEEGAEFGVSYALGDDSFNEADPDILEDCKETAWLDGGCMCTQKPTAMLASTRVNLGQAAFELDSQGEVAG